MNDFQRLDVGEYPASLDLLDIFLSFLGIKMTFLAK